jgi:murein DD-endopeptidase MepM/ murein hydrolase activator NlpD
MADNRSYVYRRLRRELGLTPAQAAGAVGGLGGESGRSLDPNAVNPTSGALGIGQWLGGRARGVRKGDVRSQTDHLIAELKGPERAALSQLKSAHSIEDATSAWVRAFERPSPAEIASSMPARLKFAREAFTQLGASGGSSLPAPVAATRTKTVIPGATIRTTIPTVDQAGFEQARKTALIGQMIARRNPNSFLLRSGLLGTTEPTLSDFTGSKTITDKIPGATVTSPGVPASTGGGGSVAGGAVHSPVGRRAKVIGVPYQGTHTLGNWQSDNAVDISVPIGSPMLALQDGVVVKVRHHPQGAGRFAGDQITVRGANGNEYFYAHGVAHVRPGQRIRKGQKLGTTGSANGVAHLHFGQMRGDPRMHT